MSNSVTVAISTFREAYFEWVVELLESLENQTMRDFEAVVVVNGNRKYFEKLLDVVKNKLDISYDINVLSSFDKGIAHSRNTALKHAKTRYIAYTDDDAIPHTRWLEELLRILELKEKVGAATGPVLGRWEPSIETYSFWFPEELYWIIGCTPWKIEKVAEVRNGFASNLALKREVLLEVGGFNENFGYNPKNPMVGEEPELGMRLRSAGYATLWSPDAVVYHRIFRERLRIRNILTRSFVEGKTKAYLSKVYGSNLIKTEVDHLQSVIKRFVKTGSFKSKALLSLSTMAVLSGYLIYKAMDARTF